MAGHRVGILHATASECRPARAMERPLAELEITEGPVFAKFGRMAGFDRGLGNSVASPSKRATGSGTQDFVVHGRRSGHVTQASLNKVRHKAIMGQREHWSSSSIGRNVGVLGAFDENAAPDS